MEKIKINLHKIDLAAVAKIVDYLRRGKVVVLPTDTIYGLHALAADRRAVNRVRLIKKSDKDKPLIKLASSLAMVRRYSFMNLKQAHYLRAVWPGLVTVILAKKRPLLPASGENSIAFRLPKNEFLTTIIRKLKQPIVSTSLNLSGHQALKSVEPIAGHFPGHKPDLVVDAGKLKAARPSKIIDIRDINNIKIIRN